ncbi:MAG: hypothetical protein ACR2PX_25325 [Endozoicomonas sp.]|uniref:hypothetical protein n=1 Tax=Endozoicomonas sp. TaxID=1892382 RepID=UPI003D9B159B
MSPFHFFPGTPFDGSIQAMSTHQGKAFVLITVYRALAKNGGWTVIPQHPLAEPQPEMLEYDKGIEAIDWDAMDLRDYHNAHSKSVCMAECLSPAPVKDTSFVSIFVPNEEVRDAVLTLKKARGATFHVNTNSHMFLTTESSST